MKLERKLSFVCIPMSITESDVKKINISRSLFQVFLHYIYFVFKKFLKYRKEIFTDFILYENGMEIDKSFIPYEYIISFNDSSLLLLAKKEDDKIVPFDNVLNIKFDKTFDSSIVKNNLYYHLKYNSINVDALQQFKNVTVRL